MTTIEVDLASVILQETFGEVVHAVGTFLMKEFAPQTLVQICTALSMPMRDVNPAAYQLLLHNLAEVSENPKGLTQFTVESKWVLNLLIQSQCVTYVKSRLDDVATLIMEEFAVNASMCMSIAIKTIVEKLHDASEESMSARVSKVRDAFVKLVQHRFLHRSFDILQHVEKKVEVSEGDVFLIPEIDLGLLEKTESGGSSPEQPSTSKRKKNAKKEFPDIKINWRINYEEFEFNMRNDAIIDTAMDIIDKNGATIIKALIDLSQTVQYSEKKMWTESMPPVMYFELLNHLTKQYKMTAKTLDPYLAVMTTGEYCFISKVDDRCGGVYVVNTKKIMQKLAEENAAFVVQEKFGSKYSRMFRLLLKKKYLEQKQLEEFSMISPKDAKQFSYELMEDCFVSTLEISKTPDYAPNRTIYLFHVNLKEVCRLIIQICYKTIGNLMLFSEKYRKDQSRLMDKKMRLDVIISTLEQSGADAEQIAEVAEILTPPEKETLEKVEKSFKKLDVKVCQVISMVQVLKAYIRLSNLR